MNRSILAGALLISLAILLNGYLDRTSHVRSHPWESSVRSTFRKAFDPALVKNVNVQSVHYSDDSKVMQVEFKLVCTDGRQIESAIGLNRDEFGAYHGRWAWEKINCPIEVN